jgi:HD superfamily phosphohydrolase
MKFRMNVLKTNKRKIINDPVFGFINLQSEIVFDLIEHPYFQRLRRIKQLGLSCLVFPGATHTRFEHAIGSLHLIYSAIDVLRLKGIDISIEEADAVAIAILLHDIGHGPFSHALEFILVPGVTHEALSLMLMEALNHAFQNKLDLAICIFKDEYQKRFLHQLVSSQLDMDRLDYLRRDSFFSGVVEGTIGSDRIIKMLNVQDDNLVVDKKGIYSIEQFLIARRLMYWQVYLHKTVLSAEFLLINVLKRAKELATDGIEIFGPPQLQWLLKHNFNKEDLTNSDHKSSLIENFVMLDDSDIISSIKVWANHSDSVLSYLAISLINRRLYKIKISDIPFSTKKIEYYKKRALEKFFLKEVDVDYFVFHGDVTNSAYESDSENILILFNSGKIADIKEASDIDLAALSKKVKKYYLCYPKDLDTN